MLKLMTETEARTFREAANGYVTRINRMTVRQLSALLREDLAALGRVTLVGGPVRKDEFISALMELHYPSHKHNETTHVLYHHEAPSEVCEWCTGPQRCGNCDATATEDCKDWCGARDRRIQPSAWIEAAEDVTAGQIRRSIDRALSLAEDCPQRATYATEPKTADDMLTELAAINGDRYRVTFLSSVPTPMLREMADLCGVDATDMPRSSLVTAICGNF